MRELSSLLSASAARHSHLCPRQVLGVRMGLLGIKMLGLRVPRKDKRLLVIIETDGCFADGIMVATGTSVGARTLRIQDYGKIAATFVDIKTGKAIRLAPRQGIRTLAWEYAPSERRQYFAQLKAYQVMPEEELFSVQQVDLTPSAQVLISRAGVRTSCSVCGEEIINQREFILDGNTLCHACYQPAYYRHSRNTNNP